MLSDTGVHTVSTVDSGSHRVRRQQGHENHQQQQQRQYKHQGVLHAACYKKNMLLLQGAQSQVLLPLGTAQSQIVADYCCSAREQVC